MQIIGKIIGGILGFMMAGPFGTIIGLIIGNMFDIGLNKHLSQAYQHFKNEKRETVVSAFIKTISCLLGFFAKADGRVSVEELNFANQVFNNLHFNKTQLLNAKDWFTNSKNGQISINDQIRMLQYLKEKNLSLCKICLDVSLQMMKIDGLNEKKISTLNKILSELGFITIDNIFSQSDFRETYQPASFNSLDTSFQTLNLNSSASKTEVKKSYRKLMSQYHPDKMIAKGVSEQELKKATETTQRISKAYEHICSVKGWK